MHASIDEARSTAGRQVTITVTYGGTQRDIAVFVPSRYAPPTALPVVVALHGGGGDASVMYAPDKGIVAHAEQDGFIAVFPNGLPKPDRPNSTNYFWDDPINIGYMAFLLDQMSARYAIDTRRIYFVGFSGGAKLIYRLAADPLLSPRIAAIATVAGMIGDKRVEPANSPWTMVDPSMSGGSAIPAFLVQGARDRRLPVDGGFDDEGEQITVGFETKIAIWRHFTSAHTEIPYPRPLPPNVHARTWIDPATEYHVVAVVDTTLAHQWPNDWDAMDEFWRFFDHMPLR
jgi:poly(3-hydroxybutyrate) depolymerase